MADNMNNFQAKINFIWEIADLLRGDYLRHEYADVILPMTVLRRLDQAMEDQREEVWDAYDRYQGRVDDMRLILRNAAKSSIYNTSKFNWQTLLDAPLDLGENLIAYLNGFSDEVRDIIEKFDFRRQVVRLQAADTSLVREEDEGKAGLLYSLMKEFGTVDLHPNTVKNTEMGYIFEELIRRFSEQYNATAGEHFTPREVIELMVKLLITEDDPVLHQPNIIRTVYDCACGTGGMLTVTKDYILGKNDKARVLLFGQEINPTAFAVAKSDMLIKGEEPDQIAFGNSFSEDGHRESHFNYMLSNPPYGVSWKKVEGIIKREHERQGYDGRFGAGLPRINDGSLLFLQHLLAKMKEDDEGSRIAIIFNASPLFTGDAGSGESEIRRWIIEQDWLEGIVGLPDQLFYNTGINTYVWIVTNRKSEKRKGKVQLVNAVSFYERMSKSSKRNKIGDAQIDKIAQVYHNFNESVIEIPVELIQASIENGEDGEPNIVQQNSSDLSLIFDQIDFGYRKIRVERPLRLNFQTTPERISRLEEQSAFQNLAKSRKKEAEARKLDIAAGKAHQQAIRELLASMSDKIYKDRAVFINDLNSAAREQGVKLTKTLRNAIIAAIGEKDETAEICYDDKGHREPDTDLRDHENIPLFADDEDVNWDLKPGESILDEKVPLRQSVYEYFETEVKPYVPDAFLDFEYVDEKDNRLGRIGYEINFTRYFYRYQSPRPLITIERELDQLKVEIVDLLNQVTHCGEAK